MELKGSDRRVLRGLGHELKPCVTIGKDGVSAHVLEAIDGAHASSELIKVKVLDTCAQDRHDVAEELQQRSGSEVVQLLGRTVLLYRRDPDEPRIALPSAPLPGRRP
jgi:RNA-binding protein